MAWRRSAIDRLMCIALSFLHLQNLWCSFPLSPLRVSPVPAWHASVTAPARQGLVTHEEPQGLNMASLAGGEWRGRWRGREGGDDHSTFIQKKQHPPATFSSLEGANSDIIATHPRSKGILRCYVCALLDLLVDFLLAPEATERHRPSLPT